MINVHFTFNSEPIACKQFDALVKSLPPGLVENFGYYTRWQDRQAALLGKLLLYHALKKNGCTEPFILHYSTHQRPYLDIPIDFNISHSGNLVVCATTNHGRIGVDVEEIKSIDFETFKNVMSVTQWQEILTSGNPMTSFYRYWTLKESLIKADGQGISNISLDEICIHNDESYLNGQNWFVLDLPLHPSYSGSLAFNEKQDVKIEQFFAQVCA